MKGNSKVGRREKLQTTDKHTRNERTRVERTQVEGSLEPLRGDRRYATAQLFKRLSGFERGGEHLLYTGRGKGTRRSSLLWKGEKIKTSSSAEDHQS